MGFGKMEVLLSLLMPNYVAPVVEHNRILSFTASRLMNNVNFYRDIEKILRKEDPSAVCATTPVQDEMTSD